MVGHTTARPDLFALCVKDSFLWALGTARSKTDRVVPGVEDQCTYTEEKKRSSGLGAQVIHGVGHTRNLSLGRTEMNCYVHNIPGRLRVKTPRVKRNRASARHVEGLIKQLRGINSTAVNITTGSVVVLYNPKTITCAVILNTLENEGFFDSSRAVSCDEYINEAASKAGQLLGKILFGAFVEKAFEGSALSYVAAFI